MSEIEITQADREAAARCEESLYAMYGRAAAAKLAAHTRSGGRDHGKWVKEFARHRHEARADGEGYKRALMDIGAALLAGRVCDDVAWFDSVETLFDFVSRALEPDHTEPAPDMLGNFPISPDERRVIAWLRGQEGEQFAGDSAPHIASAIERGEHRK